MIYFIQPVCNFIISTTRHWAVQSTKVLRTSSYMVEVRSVRSVQIAILSATLRIPMRTNKTTSRSRVWSSISLRSCAVYTNLLEVFLGVWNTETTWNDRVQTATWSQVNGHSSAKHPFTVSQPAGADGTYSKFLSWKKKKKKQLPAPVQLMERHLWQSHPPWSRQQQGKSQPTFPAALEVSNVAETREFCRLAALVNLLPQAALKNTRGWDAQVSDSGKELTLTTF